MDLTFTPGTKCLRSGFLSAIILVQVIYGGSIFSRILRGGEGTDEGREKDKKRCGFRRSLF